MADFGVAGKVTIRKDAVGVEVNVTDGEYLVYQLEVEGASAIFRWTCEHKLRLQEGSFPGHPKQTYDWTWCRQNPEQRDSNDDLYTLEMRFSSATKYTLVVDLMDRNHSRIKRVKDLDFESRAPQDWFGSTLRIFAD